MRFQKVAPALLLLFAPLAHGTSNAVCSATPPGGQAVVSCGGSGGVTSPITGDFAVSGKWSWPSAGAANAVEVGETAGCVTFEVTGSNANETRLCATEFADATFNLPGALVNAGTYNLYPNDASVTAYGIGYAAPTSTVINAYMSAAGFGMYKDAQVLWTSDTSGNSIGVALTNKDAGIARLGPSRLKITDGTTGSGGLQQSQPVSPQITTYTTTVDDSATLFTNTGDADGATITLLNDPSAGVNHDFAVTASQTFTIQPSAGEQLFLLDTACASINSATVGGILHVVAATAGSGAIWVSQATGAWTCTP